MKDSGISRRSAFFAIAGVASAAVVGLRAQTKPATKTPILVFKDPTCGCCSKWIDHINANGFAAQVTDGDMTPVKKRYQVPRALESCHTAAVGGYVIEGHVPASDIRRLLAEKPKHILGLTIPGMPQSAPGMDVKPFHPYDVLTFDAKGQTTVYVKHTKG
jgi:hypothetical protein